MSGQGFTYDLNGNLITDNEGRQFSFNGDNKQIEVKDAANNVVGIYCYDGSGKRVKKISVSETTIFIYNANGKLVAEYSTQVSSNPTINYLTNDVLGSPRVITDNGGNVVSRRDFMPFGEELYAGTANRSESTKYSITGIDSVRKRYTGYEKDIETNLDFAEARYYNNKYGRFTAVDPLLASGQSTDPQSFNRYVYVQNNPIVMTDRSGLCINCTDRTWFSLGQDYFMGIGSLLISPWLPPPTFTSSTYIIYKQTTTYTVTTQVDQSIATVESTVEQTVIFKEGDLNPYHTNPDFKVNTGFPVNSGKTDFSESELSTFKTVVNSIVFNAVSRGFDVSLALAIAQKETRFGLFPSSEKSAAKKSDINPLQASDGRAVAPGGKYSNLQALDYNVNEALTIYNEKRGKDMSTRLEQYRGSGTSATDTAYSNEVTGFYNNIQNSRKITRVELSRYNGNIKTPMYPLGTSEGP